MKKAWQHEITLNRKQVAILDVSYSRLAQGGTLILMGICGGLLFALNGSQKKNIVHATGAVGCIAAYLTFMSETYTITQTLEGKRTAGLGHSRARSQPVSAIHGFWMGLSFVPSTAFCLVSIWFAINPTVASWISVQVCCPLALTNLLVGSSSQPCRTDKQYLNSIKRHYVVVFTVPLTTVGIGFLRKYLGYSR